MRTEVASFLSRPPKAGSGRSITCKFVILVHDNVLWLVLGRVREFPYHAQLVERFCNLNMIPSHWVKKPDLVEILDHATRVQGGGWLEINPAQRTCAIYGHSTAYGAFNSADIRQVVEEQSFFAGYDVAVS